MAEFNLADLFEVVADAVRGRTALVCGERRLTYAELDARANRAAHHLVGAGVRAGEHVGLYMRNSTAYVETMLGALKIRAVPINVNFRYVEEELRYLLDDADVVALVHAREFIPRVASVKGSLPALRTLLMVDDDSGIDPSPLAPPEYESSIAAASPARDFAPRSPDDLFMIYTGGTTGMPKGVMWRQEDFFYTCLGGGNPTGEAVKTPEQLAENALARDPQIVQFIVAPLIHGAGQLGLFIGLNWGDKVCVAPRFDPEEILATIARERVNTLFLVGDAMARPVAETLAARGGPDDLSSLVYVGSSGAVLSESVKDLLRAQLPNAFLGESFGSTETGYQGVEAQGAARPESGRRFMMDDRTAVFDEGLRRVEPGSGAVGRLAMRGRIPLGYYKDEAKTAKTFVEVDGQRWVMPGDVATVDADGTIVVFGRGSVCINSGGEKIYPEEVEQALKSHPDVYDAVVVGVPDERWGERVTAVLQPRPGRSPALDEIDAHCRARIAGYKVPRSLVLVEQVQRHPSGKPDYPWAKRVALEALADA